MPWFVCGRCEQRTWIDKDDRKVCSFCVKLGKRKGRRPEEPSPSQENAVRILEEGFNAGVGGKMSMAKLGQVRVGEYLIASGRWTVDGPLSGKIYHIWDGRQWSPADGPDMPMVYPSYFEAQKAISDTPVPFIEDFITVMYLPDFGSQTPIGRSWIVG